MDRLTKRNPDGRVGIAPLRYYNYEDIQGVFNRLAAYEDTGLTPEEIQGLCEMDKRSRMAQMLRWEQAEAEGRLLILPCNVGDSVFALTDVCLCPIDERCCGDCTGAGCRYASCEVRECKTDSIIQIIRLTEKIGKTVFLTREEAERALERMT